jgi:hypothetical protein
VENKTFNGTVGHRCIDMGQTIFSASNNNSYYVEDDDDYYDGDNTYVRTYIHTCKARNQGATENSHTGHCTHNSESTDVKYNTVYLTLQIALHAQ